MDSVAVLTGASFRTLMEEGGPANGYTPFMNPPPPRRRFRLGLPLVLVAATLALLGGWHLVHRVTASSEYERALARYDAAGGPRDFASLAPPALPAEKDGTALYLKAVGVTLSDYREEAEDLQRRNLLGDERF